MAVLSSPVIDLAIGLTFVFAVTAALASLLTEFIARFLGLRGAYLLSGLRELVDSGEKATVLTNAATDYKTMQTLIKGPPYANDKALDDQAPVAGQAPPVDPEPADPKPATPSVTAALLGGPILGNQGVVGQIVGRNLTLNKTAGQRDGSLATITSQSGTKRSQLRSLPSYISSRSFADAVIDLVVPDAQGQTTLDTIQKNIQELPDPFKTSLGALAKNANGDVSKFRTSVEQWYDDHMDRVSGWYKRRTAWITLVVGAIVIVLLNLNALSIGRTLYTENAVSAAVSSVAAKTTPCTTVSQDCLSTLDGDLSAAASSGLPVGWGTVRACKEQGVHCGWWQQRGILSPSGSAGSQAAQVLLVLLGFLIMIVALLPGAQFWFGLLSKLGTLRSTGPKPATSG
jgi:hypothetical protein